MKTINCPVCNTQNNYTEEKGVLCNKCKCLINSNAKAYDYLLEGGQNIPDKNKHLFRLKNCQLRFKIIKKFSNKNQIFVDIGTGSGEMLMSSKNYFKKSVGFEHSKDLNNFYKENKIEVYNSNFDINKLGSSLKNNESIFFSFSHVIEHNSNPIDLINEIISQHNNVSIYIEVPLFTGLSFKTEKYNWKLWYDQHNALYSLETLKFIANKLTMNILETGHRTFASENYSYKKNILLFLKNPFRFFKTCLMFLFNNKNTFMDLFLKDYGYIIATKIK